eukprot:scaffold2.g7245.t1
MLALRSPLPWREGLQAASYATGPLSSLVESLVARPDAAYPTHVPLNSLQKSAVALVSLAGALADPRRGDLVAAAGETTALPVLPALRDRMLRSEEGRAVLAERPRVTWEAVRHCWELPPHTFGGAYARFMGDRSFLAGDRPPVRFVDDPELAYVITRVREVHDFWHVLFGCHTNGFGEAPQNTLRRKQQPPTEGDAAAAADAAGPVPQLQQRQRQGGGDEVAPEHRMPMPFATVGTGAEAVTLYYVMLAGARALDAYREAIVPAADGARSVAAPAGGEGRRRASPLGRLCCWGARAAGGAGATAAAPDGRVSPPEAKAAAGAAIARAAAPEPAGPELQLAEPQPQPQRREAPASRAPAQLERRLSRQPSLPPASPGPSGVAAGLAAAPEPGEGATEAAFEARMAAAGAACREQLLFIMGLSERGDSRYWEGQVRRLLALRDGAGRPLVCGVRHYSTDIMCRDALGLLDHLGAAGAAAAAARDSRRARTLTVLDAIVGEMTADIQRKKGLYSKEESRRRHAGRKGQLWASFSHRLSARECRLIAASGLRVLILAGWEDGFVSPAHTAALGAATGAAALVVPAAHAGIAIEAEEEVARALEGQLAGRRGDAGAGAGRE